ncbi:MAG: V-type ATP synthase subunit I [Alistipes sp.]|nr:V-type ATP synthase subunit I [Alistipes sp.]
MSRYDFVLLAAQSDDFIARLRELGLVDITTTGWEPQEKDRQLVVDIENYRKAVEALKGFAQGQEYSLAEGAHTYTSGKEAFEKYNELRQQKAALQAEVARLEKYADELKPWGDFDGALSEKLQQQGIVLRYFQTQASTFDKLAEEWSVDYTIVEISRDASTTYFVVVTTPGADIVIDAQEIKAPIMDSRAAEAEVEKCRQSLEAMNAEFSVCAASVEAIEAEWSKLVNQLQNVKIKGTAAEAADGALVVMEGWAEEDKSAEVDKLLDEYSDVIYLKRDAAPEDDTPVKLKNNKFARLFELIGAMYALPKYGTMDLTPFFAPFYMLFFAICLNDAGYGAILTAIGLVLLTKSSGGFMKQAAWLTVFCGGATTLFGLYTGSLFGMSIPDMLGYESIAASPFLDFQNQFFSLALALGVVQILFGMFLNICLQTKLFGFTSTFGLLGWFIILLSGCLAVGLPMLNENLTISWFTASSPAFYAAMGVGAVLMLLLNNIKRNPLINIGSGLWDAYNNVTGLLSDVLSYIRLFAIGLSGGVLAQVFNSLAMGLTGLDAGIESFGVGTIFQIIGATAILLIGHGINLFMSAISSFVHPMRLTFVEFYKNAGFEMTTRQFEPLTNEKK